MPKTKQNTKYAPWKNDGDWKERNLKMARQAAKHLGLNLDEREVKATYPGKNQRCGDEIPVLVPYLGVGCKNSAKQLADFAAMYIADIGFQTQASFGKSVRKRCEETIEVKAQVDTGFRWRLVTIDPFPKMSIQEAEEQLENLGAYLAGPEVLALIAVDPLIITHCVLGGYRAGLTINPTAVELYVRQDFVNPEDKDNSDLMHIIKLEASNAVQFRSEAPMPIARPYYGRRNKR